MRILTYKRTHTGDPDFNGHFGINGCMGRVRNFTFDAVIGVGGIGHEPKSYGIDGKINWIGFKPRKRKNLTGDGVIVKFKKFVLFEHLGPVLNKVAPNLAHRMYQGGVRFILTGYSKEEKEDAENIIRWLLKQSQVKPRQFKISRGRVSCVKKCRPIIRLPKCRKTTCRKTNNQILSQATLPTNMRLENFFSSTSHAQIKISKCQKEM